MTEMWERFAYYLLAGILLLYLKNGKQFTPEKAADITGSFIALIWLPRRPVPGLYQIHLYRRQPSGCRLPGPDLAG